MTTRAVAAIDIGSSSGRVAKVTFDGDHLVLNVIHRFHHRPVSQGGVLRWDMAALRNGVDEGLSALAAGSTRVDSVGVDSFGVDYALLDAKGELITQPSCHRDARNVAAMNAAIAQIGAIELYDATGVQLTPINSIFSLMADVSDRPEVVARAEKLLMIPDYIHYLLCGSVVTEYTSASTTAALDIRSGEWNRDLLEQLGLPTRIFSEVVAPGTQVGTLTQFGGALRDTRVIVPAAHDTASAIVATPLKHSTSVFISSGTWSLVGVEIDRPVVTSSSRHANLTNEGGYHGKVCLLKNVTGLWILQECQRSWAEEGQRYTYQEIASLAEDASGLRSVIHSSSLTFIPPNNMPRRIQDYCARSGERVPQTVGEIARCAIDSLALSYRMAVQSIAEVVGTHPPVVNIVGGGSAHNLLSQLTSNAIQAPVICGPEEATTYGNAAVQLAALGEFRGMSDIRAAVMASSQVRHFFPTDDYDWEAATVRVERQVELEIRRPRENTLSVPASRLEH